MSEASISNDDLAALVTSLELDVTAIGICHDCLSFVSFPLAQGDEEDARSRRP